jgi:anaerobic sulfite reductase subunit C
VVISIVDNVYDYIERHIDTSLTKEHVGYIVDRTGYPQFKEEILDGVDLNSECEVADKINWNGYQTGERI